MTGSVAVPAVAASCEALLTTQKKSPARRPDAPALVLSAAWLWKGVPILATIVLDAYRQTEAAELRAALKSLLPKAGPHWSRTGLYCYFDPLTHEILYLGLAKDLQARFAQHNALVGKDARGNKRQEIANYFAESELLGFSIYVQSAAVELLEIMGLETAAQIVGFGEGQLLRSHVQAFGAVPRWNKIEGLRDGAEEAGPLTPQHFTLLSGKHDSLFVARRTIRGLDDDYSADFMEQTLHGARLNALLSGAGRPGGVGDAEIRDWLSKLSNDPRWGGSASSVLMLEESGYLREPAPDLVRRAPGQGSQ